MSEDFEIRKAKDGRVIVVLHPRCATTKEAVLSLLSELGIEATDVDFLLPDEAANCTGIDDMPVVVLIDEADCDAPELDRASQQCAQAGGRVIVLFDKSFAYDGLHPIADKYGTQCGWSGDQLDACIKNEDLAPPRSSDGSKVSRPKTEQVKC